MYHNLNEEGYGQGQLTKSKQYIDKKEKKLPQLFKDLILVRTFAKTKLPITEDFASIGIKNPKIKKTGLHISRKIFAIL